MDSLRPRPHTNSTPRRSAAIRLAAAAACSTLLAACGGSSAGRGNLDNPSAAELIRPLPESSDPGAVPMPTIGDSDAIAQAPFGLDTGAPRRSRIEPGAAAPSESPAAGPRASAGSLAAIDAPPASTATPDTSASPADQLSTKAAELRAILVERAAGSKDPLAASLALAALDAAIAPPTGAAQPTAALSPAEQRIAQVTRDTLAKLIGSPGSSGDPAKAADLLTAAAESLTRDSGVRISYAGLCRRVESFGRFEPFTSTAFLAGRAHRAIVYVELDRFTSRPPGAADLQTSEGSAWVVEVSQELELIHDADGRQQWYRPPQTIADTSRTRRRDFYLINTIDLPTTLSVGAYSLKVTIRDKTSGATDERIIPLQIIADGSALQSPRAASALK